MTAVYHPRPDEKGNSVLIRHPSLATPSSSWADPVITAIFVPDGKVPLKLNGIAMNSWGPSKDFGAWEIPAEGMEDYAEPEFICSKSLQPAAGAVILEPDGRVWLVEPTNRFGGYQYTMPKGRTDGKSLRATALVEVYEETGLAIELTHWLCDVDRSITRTRFYLAKRIGGSPAACGWETQACVLAPVTALSQLLTHPGDRQVLDALVVTLKG